MEITKREVLASVSIVAVMLLIGFLISGKIQNSIMDNNERYNKAVKIEDEELFRYGMDTNVGNAFVYGELEAVDTVTFPEIGGEYMYVEKEEEHYNILEHIQPPMEKVIQRLIQRFTGHGITLVVRANNVKKYHSAV